MPEKCLLQFLRAQDVLLYVTNFPKPKDIQFIVIESRENQKILTLKRLFDWKMTEIISQLST